MKWSLRFLLTVVLVCCVCCAFISHRRSMVLQDLMTKTEGIDAELVDQLAARPISFEEFWNGTSNIQVNWSNGKGSPFTIYFDLD